MKCNECAGGNLLKGSIGKLNYEIFHVRFRFS